MKKRLISLMLAGAMVGAVGTMAACDYETSTEHENQITDQAFTDQYKYDDGYIVLEQNGKNVLHHGDAKQLPNIYVDTTSNNWLYDFDCAAPFVADWQHAFFEEKPSQAFYNEECDDCINN